MADTNPPNRTPPHLRAVRDGESPPRRNPRLTQTQRLQIMGMIETHLLNGIRRKQIFNMLRQAAEKGMPMPDGSRTFLPRVSQTLFQQMLSEIDAEIAEDARQSLQQNLSDQA